MNIKKMQKNLATNMPLYSTLAIAMGLITGYYLINLLKLSEFIILRIFMAIYQILMTTYPMINLSLDNIKKKIKSTVKQLVETIDFMKLKVHLDKYLIPYVVVAMILGFIAGLHINVEHYKNIFSTLNMIVVITMIYPMMINLRIEALAKASKSWKQLTLAILIGLIYAPLLVFGLTLLLHMSPVLSLGLILATVVPCSSMAIAYTGLSEGNIELATVIVALSFTLAIVTVPGWLSIFAGAYHLSVSAWLLIKTILIVVIVPLILGYITRILLLSKMGVKGFERLRPLFPSISILGMFAIVALIFMEKAKLLASKPSVVGMVIIPLALYYSITLLLMTYLDKKIGLNYEDHMAIVFTSVGKNEGTAIAIAVAAGMGLMAIPPAITPILQIPFLVGYLKLSQKIRKWWAK